EPIRYFSLPALWSQAKEAAEKDTPAEVVRRVLADSLAHHRVSDVRVGLFLSGGIDSSVLAALSAEEGSSPLKAVTLAFQEYAGTADDELPTASAVAEQCGISHAVRTLEASETAREMERCFSCMDQ